MKYKENHVSESLLKRIPECLMLFRLLDVMLTIF